MLKINQNLVPREVRKLLFSVVKNRLERKMEHYALLVHHHYNLVFCIFGFEAVASGLDDISKNRLKCSDVPGIISLLCKYITTL